VSRSGAGRPQPPADHPAARCRRAQRPCVSADRTTTGVHRHGRPTHRRHRQRGPRTRPCPGQRCTPDHPVRCRTRYPDFRRRRAHSGDGTDQGPRRRPEIEGPDPEPRQEQRLWPEWPRSKRRTKRRIGAHSTPCSRSFGGKSCADGVVRIVVGIADVAARFRRVRARRRQGGTSTATRPWRGSDTHGSP
jgi:hypothetical protein